MEKRERGTGSLLLIGKIWYIRYYVRGKQRQQTTRQSNRKIAAKMLQKRMGEVAANIAREPGRVKYENLRDAFLADCIKDDHKSLRFAQDGTRYLTRLTWPDKFFKGYKAASIDADALREFTKMLQAEGQKAATINRSLAALRRMFKLAVKDKKLRENDLPHFAMLKESNVRKGFFEPWQYLALRDTLPDYARLVLAIGYYTGMRLGEIKGLRWEQVDFMDGVIRLDVGETKNDEGRKIPITSELDAMLRAQHAKRHAGCPLVCFRIEKGKALPIGDFRKVWQSRCAALGLTGKLFHDLRRTGVRNLVRAGVPESVAMAISGHKTRSIFDRYDITSESDVKSAGAKLEAYTSKQNEEISSRKVESGFESDSTNTLSVN